MRVGVVLAAEVGAKPVQVPGIVRGRGLSIQERPDGVAQAEQPGQLGRLAGAASTAFTAPCLTAGPRVCGSTS